MRCGLECSGHRLINGKEFAQLDYPTLLMKLADHGGSFEVERCEQVDRAVAQIVRRAPLGLAATHRQHWLAGVCRKCCIREPYNEAWLGRGKGMAANRESRITDEVVNQLLAGRHPATVTESGGLVDELKKRLAERILNG